VALLEKRRFLNNHSGDFPQVILILSQSRAEQVCTLYNKLFHIVIHLWFRTPTLFYFLADM
jgi:hypothetical protein